MYNRKINSFWQLLAAIILMFQLTACGSGATETSALGDEAKNSDPAAKSDDISTAGDAGVKSDTAAPPAEITKAVWVSTAWGIDWPSPDSRQRFSEALDLIKKMGLNTVFFQVRPMGDALYPSKLAPWSAVTSGTLGKAAAFDPLQFAIDEAKKRGLKIHAWFNPFRISTDPKFDRAKYLAALPDTSPLKKNAWWIVKYEGSGKVYNWLNPGTTAVRKYIVDVVTEVLENYAVDGIHIDDYFYPYPLTGVEFPDAAQFKAYGAKFANVGDWRRDNVNQTVKAIKEAIKSRIPDVQFGVSPFGIWKNGVNEGGAGTRGLSSYSAIYCDTKKFIDEAWIDYVVPQLYWKIGNPAAPYDTLAQWWAQQVEGKKVALYIGHNAGGEFPDAQELTKQIALNKTIKNISGSSFFTLRDLINNKNNSQQQIADGLKDWTR